MTISSVTTGSIAAAPSDMGQTVVPTPSTATGSEAPKPVAAEAAAGSQAPSPEQIARAVKQINITFSQTGQNIYASIERDKTTGIDVIKFRDTDTKEVISQYPPKAIIAIAEALGRSQEAKGRLLNINA